MFFACPQYHRAGLACSSYSRALLGLARSSYAEISAPAGRGPLGRCGSFVYELYRTLSIQGVSIRSPITSFCPSSPSCNSTVR